MLSEFSKLFDRDYVIGYLLPTLLFSAFGLVLLGNFGFVTLADILQYLSKSNLTGELAIALVIWCTSVLLLALNRPLIRFLEGYGFLRLTPLRYWQVKQFRRLEKQVEEITKQYSKELEQGVTPKTIQTYQKLLILRRNRFPDR